MPQDFFDGHVKSHWQSIKIYLTSDDMGRRDYSLDCDRLVAPHESCSTNVNSENNMSSKRSKAVKGCSLEEAISTYFQTE